MEVQLFVYDLARGMARTLSGPLLGIQLDAVYHTSIVFDGVEYFYGRGIHTSRAGLTHHGRPIEVIPMGTTHLPKETILEYLESLRDVYSAESYDLFAHNCNNFTNDFGMFLTGRGIPEHITNLPKQILDTPMGQMFKSQIDASMREITQAPVLPSSRSPSAATRGTPVDSSRSNAVLPAENIQTTSSLKQNEYGTVVNVTDKDELQNRLRSASQSAVTIFFTSSTCAPCKVAYPMFDRLAEQHPQALFVKVDINSARDIASFYQIRATPTFMTFAKGEQQDTWTGADPNVLKANVANAVQKAFPPHPHASVNVPSLQNGSLKPVVYSKIPPLDKLMGKLGASANDATLAALRNFVQKRNLNPKDAPLPDLKSISGAFVSRMLALPVEVRFAVVDLLRCAIVDPRVGAFFAEEPELQPVAAIVKHVVELDDCPHNLRLVTIHLTCNVFASQPLVKKLLEPNSTLAALLVQLVSSSLLDHSHPTTKAAAASLAFDIASANYRIRREDAREGLGETEQVELAASLLEALNSEDNGHSVKLLLFALGYLLYYAPQEGELMDLATALDAKTIISNRKEESALAKEVASLF